MSKIQHKSGIWADCIAASIYEHSKPIFTLVTKAPKYLDAEFEKHRMLSSNSSSSRAIPVEKILEQVDEAPWTPPVWRREQKGMQGFSELTHKEADDAFVIWHNARICAIKSAKQLYELKVHKQHVNRLLEPWMFQYKIITATEWDNFFALRCHPNADPGIQILATTMRTAIENAEVVDRSDNTWHLPFITPDEQKNYSAESNLMVSAARCARISYARHGTKTLDRDSDIILASRLRSDRHLTPFEHQARKLILTDPENYFRDKTFWSGNFRGWHQFRKEIEQA